MLCFTACLKMNDTLYKTWKFFRSYSECLELTISFRKVSEYCTEGKKIQIKLLHHMNCYKVLFLHSYAKR